VQNLDHRLTDAAQSLGAPAWRAHLSITVPLCMPGLLAAFLPDRHTRVKNEMQATS